MLLIFVVRDERGESENYEAFSMLGWNAEEGRRVWTEGIRKDRCMMWPSMRVVIEAILSEVAP